MMLSFELERSEYKVVVEDVDDQSMEMVVWIDDDNVDSSGS